MSRDLSTLRKCVAYCLLGIAVLAVGYRWIVRDDPLDRVPDDDALKTAWICDGCGEVQQLTPRQRVAWQRKASDYTVGGRKAGDDIADPEGRTSFRELILQCPRCGRMELRKAAICPSCRAAFRANRGDKPIKCPRCGWEPARKKAKRRPAGRHPRRGG